MTSLPVEINVRVKNYGQTVRKSLAALHHGSQSYYGNANHNTRKKERKKERKNECINEKEREKEEKTNRKREKK